MYICMQEGETEGEQEGACPYDCKAGMKALIILW